MRKRMWVCVALQLRGLGISDHVLPVSLNFSFFHEEGAALGHASVAAATIAATLCQLPPAHERLAKHSGGESDMIM